MTRQTLARLLGALAALILVAGIGLFSFGLATATDETFEENLFYGGALLLLPAVILSLIVGGPAFIIARAPTTQGVSVPIALALVGAVVSPMGVWALVMGAIGYPERGEFGPLIFPVVVLGIGAGAYYLVARAIR